MKIASRGVSDLGLPFQREHQLGAGQRCKGRYFPRAALAIKPRFFSGEELREVRDNFMNYDVPELDHERRYYYVSVEGKPFALLPRGIKLKFRSICS